MANHALVMAQAAWGGIDDDGVPSRYVFDEGHHVFDAADGAFSATLSGVEGAELRRWLLGAEGGRSRARGLRRRLDDLVAGTPELETPLDAALQAARALPSQGWALRLSDGGEDATPSEAFLRLARQQVLARLTGDMEPNARTSMECDLYPVGPGLPDAAAQLARALRRIAEPLQTLLARLGAKLEDESEDLDTTARNRIEAARRSVKRRAVDRLQAWTAMLDAVGAPVPEPGVRPQHVHYLHLDRREAGDRDVGLHRHWLDPTVPFAASLAAPAHGMIVTSATLRDTGEVRRGNRLAVGGGARRRGSSAVARAARVGRQPLRLRPANPRLRRHRRGHRRVGRAGGGLPQPVPGVGRRGAGAVHRHQPAARRPRPHCA